MITATCAGLTCDVPTKYRCFSKLTDIGERNRGIPVMQVLAAVNTWCVPQPEKTFRG